jgi:hypothetical protein
MPMRPCILRRRRLVTRHLGGNRRRVKIESRIMPRNGPVRGVARIYAIFSQSFLRHCTTPRSPQAPRCSYAIVRGAAYYFWDRPSESFLNGSRRPLQESIGTGGGYEHCDSFCNPYPLLCLPEGNFLTSQIFAIRVVTPSPSSASNRFQTGRTDTL